MADSSNKKRHVRYIGLCGELGSGKSTAARRLVDLMGKQTVVVAAFAAALKEFVAGLGGCPVHDLYTNEGKARIFPAWPHAHPGTTVQTKPLPLATLISKAGISVPDSRVLEACTLLIVILEDETPHTYGWMLQYIGTDVMRYCIADDIWVRCCLCGIPKETDVVVVEDCRFPNEVEAIHARGGIVIKLARTQVGNVKAGRDSNHPSETNVKTLQCDKVVANDGSLDELSAALAVVLAEYHYM
jgi:hypothetical protein